MIINGILVESEDHLESLIKESSETVRQLLLSVYRSEQ